MTITELVELSYRQAMTSGWGDKEVPFPEQCALLHSEISEALESFRNNEPLLWLDKNKDNKPEGIASEFADVLIRIGHYSKLLNINLEEALLLKMEYNARRPHRHGGKAV